MCSWNYLHICKCVVLSVPLICQVLGRFRVSLSIMSNSLGRKGTLYIHTYISLYALLRLIRVCESELICNESEVIIN